MKISIEIYANATVYLSVGHGGWSGYEKIKLFGDGANLARKIDNYWKFFATETLVFADWFQENISEMKTINVFRQPNQEWWNAIPALIRELATRQEAELPRWA